MTTAIATGESKTSLIETMAAKYGVDPAKFFKTLRDTVLFPQATEEQMIAFLVVAARYDLDPFRGEVHAFKKDRGVQPIVGVDGWSAIINRHTMFNGMAFNDQADAQGNVTAIKCKMFRKDREYPIEATEYLKECKRNTQPWTQWPMRMLRHKAMIQAARMAFGLTGIVDPDEAERIQECESNRPAAAGRAVTSPLNQLLSQMPAGEAIDAEVEEPVYQHVEPEPAASTLANLPAELAAATSLALVNGVEQSYLDPAVTLTVDERQTLTLMADKRREEIRSKRGAGSNQQTIPATS